MNSNGRPVFHMLLSKTLPGGAQANPGMILPWMILPFSFWSWPQPGGGRIICGKIMGRMRFATASWKLPLVFLTGLV